MIKKKYYVFRFVTHAVQANDTQDISFVLFLSILVCNLASLQSWMKIYLFAFTSPYEFRFLFFFKDSSKDRVVELFLLKFITSLN